MMRSGWSRLNRELAGAAPFSVETLTAAELDVVVGGGPPPSDHDYIDSNTTSQCHVDGNNEPGTS